MKKYFAFMTLTLIGSGVFLVTNPAEACVGYSSRCVVTGKVTNIEFIDRTKSDFSIDCDPDVKFYEVSLKVVSVSSCQDYQSVPGWPAKPKPGQEISSDVTVEDYQAIGFHQGSKVTVEHSAGGYFSPVDGAERAPDPFSVLGIVAGGLAALAGYAIIRYLQVRKLYKHQL